MWFTDRVVLLLFALLYFTAVLTDKATSSVNVSPGLPEKSSNDSLVPLVGLTEQEMVSAQSQNISQESLNQNFTNIRDILELVYIDFANETLSNDKLLNETDLGEIVQNLVDSIFEKLNNVTLESYPDLTNSTSSIIFGTENSTSIASSEAQNGDLPFSELDTASLQNLMLNSTVGIENVLNLPAAISKTIKDDVDKVASLLASVEKLDSGIRTNDSGSTVDRNIAFSEIQEIESVAEKMLSAVAPHLSENVDNGIRVSEVAADPHIKRLLKTIRDASDALLQILRVSPTVQDTNENFCPEHWAYFAHTNSCYFVGQNPTSYHSASVVCSAQNAYLTSITDYSETQFINELVEGAVFLIGLRRTGDQWLWVDHSEFNYTNWRATQPDGCCGLDVNCVAVNYDAMEGEWDDLDCAIGWPVTTKFVCKKKL